MKIPENPKKIIEQLISANYSAYVVGGCVRDMQLGRPVHDWDITTDALPQQVIEALPDIRIFETGLRHGTVTAVLNGERIEITTFRLDGKYIDNRHPEDVTFTRNLEEDLSRRDFTINAMAFDGTQIIDPHGGMQDLHRQLIRAVGDPEKRFNEDALRILRGLRFSAVFGFEIEEKTISAMITHKNLLHKISAERVRDELLKLICGENAENVLMNHTDILSVILPEIVPAIGFNQRNRHHCYDVWQHTVKSVVHAPPRGDLRMAMLLHDLGKPQTFSLGGDGQGHFYGHGGKSVKIAEAVLPRLRFANEDKRKIITLVKYHDADLYPGEKSVKRWLNKLGEELLRDLIHVKRADNLAQSKKYQDRQEQLDAVEAIIDGVIAQQQYFTLKDLAVNGRDIMTLGVTGVAIGDVLDMLHEEVIDGRCENEKSALLKRAEEIIRSH